jgi:hypothetical protein
MEYVSIINSFCSEQGRKCSPRSAPQDEATDAVVLIDLNLVLRSEMSFTCVMARDSWSRLQSPGIHGSALLSVGSSCGADGGDSCPLRNEFRATGGALRFVVEKSSQTRTIMEDSSTNWSIHHPAPDKGLLKKWPTVGQGYFSVSISPKPCTWSPVAASSTPDWRPR